MHDSTLAHLSDAILLRDLIALVAQDRSTTATLLAHLGEVDSRRLYLPAGYTSMHAYCVEELHLSEDAAYKRIQAARAARQFPALFAALAEGRLHLAAVCLLSPHLTPENADELIVAATHRRKSQIEDLLARRFPPREIAESLCIVSQLAPGQVGSEIPAEVHADLDQLAPGQVRTELSAETANSNQLAPGQVDPERLLVHLIIAKSTQEKLRYAQALLSHAVPTGDVAQVLDRALDALIAQLEKRKIGTGTRGRRSSDPSDSQSPAQEGAARTRYIPTHIRRAVWERDQGKCTFTSAAGHRCAARRLLEFDHVKPAARGGKATVEGLRLRCRAHNQFEAERTFGVEFMRRKRQEARVAVTETRARAAAHEQIQDILAALRSLGCRGHEARRAAEHSAALSGASLEERMRAALAFLGRRRVRICTPAELARPLPQGTHTVIAGNSGEGQA